MSECVPAGFHRRPRRNRHPGSTSALRQSNSDRERADTRPRRAAAARMRRRAPGAASWRGGRPSADPVGLPVSGSGCSTCARVRTTFAAAVPSADQGWEHPEPVALGLVAGEADPAEPAARPASPRPTGLPHSTQNRCRSGSAASGSTVSNGSGSLAFGSATRRCGRGVRRARPRPPNRRSPIPATAGSTPARCPPESAAPRGRPPRCRATARWCGRTGDSRTGPGPRGPPAERAAPVRCPSLRWWRVPRCRSRGGAEGCGSGLPARIRPFAGAWCRGAPERPVRAAPARRAPASGGTSPASVAEPADSTRKTVSSRAAREQVGTYRPPISTPEPWRRPSAAWIRAGPGSAATR